MTTDAQILTALRAVNDGGVSGAELSQRLGISRAAIWARIEELRALGYDIEASPHLGYRLVSAPDVLHADDLLARLGKTKVVGRDIRVFQETSSTNDVAEKLARDGVKEGVVVFAESQTRGRGRLGRKWTSPSKRGLWFSVLLRPAVRPQEATRLTIASATALARAVPKSATTDRARAPQSTPEQASSDFPAGMETLLADTPMAALRSTRTSPTGTQDLVTGT